MFRHPLAREVAAVVLLKTLLVVAASLVVFAPAKRPPVTARSVAAHLAGAPSDAAGGPAAPASTR